MELTQCGVGEAAAPALLTACGADTDGTQGAVRFLRTREPLQGRSRLLSGLGIPSLPRPHSGYVAYDVSVQLGFMGMDI